MSHDPTSPPRRGVSPLRQARLDRGWSLTEVAAQIRARCPGQHGTGCRVDAGRLDHFETGLRHPSPTHSRILTELYQRTASELGLPDGAGVADQQPASHQDRPATATPDPDQTSDAPTDLDPGDADA
jgi:hypothetical protein